MSDHHEIPRRQFIKGAALGALAIAAAGCGSDSTSSFGGGNSSSNGSGTSAMTSSGTVNRAQIGGSGLQVQSAFALDSPVDSNGSYQSAFSTSGAQVILITDDGRHIRGLALWIPGAGTLTIDAQSTALGLAFLTLGILTVDVTEATQRVAKLKALPAFTALVAFLTAQLPTTPLDTLQSNTTFQTLRSQLLADFQALPKVALPKVGLASEGFLSATIQDQKVNLSNDGLRYLSIIREPVDGSNNDVGPPVVPDLGGAQNPVPSLAKNVMSGANLLSWGNLLTSQVASPGSATDSFDPASLAGTRQVNYWSAGLGRPQGSLVVLPASIPVDLFNQRFAGFCTFAFYMLGPFLDILGGGGDALAARVKVPEVAVGLAGAGVNIAALVAAVNGYVPSTDPSVDSFQNIKSAFLDLMGSLVGVSATLGEIYAQNKITAALKLLAKPLAAPQTLFSLFNLTSYFLLLVASPPIAKFALPVGVHGYRSEVVAQSANFFLIPVDVDHVGKVLYYGESFDGASESILALHDPSSPPDTVLQHVISDPPGPNQVQRRILVISSSSHYLNNIGDSIYSTFVNTRVLLTETAIYRSADGVEHPLDFLPTSHLMIAMGLNASGVVVGTWRAGADGAGSGPVQGFRWEAGITSDLSLAAGVNDPTFTLTVIDINDRGDIAGYGSGQGRNIVFFLPAGGGLTRVAPTTGSAAFISLDDFGRVLLQDNGGVYKLWDAPNDRITPLKIPASSGVSRMARGGQILGQGPGGMLVWSDPLGDPQLVPFADLPPGFHPQIIGDAGHIVGQGDNETLYVLFPL